MQKILVVCPTDRDKKELTQLKTHQDYSFVFQNYDATGLERIIYEGAGWLAETFDPAQAIDQMVATCREESINAIVCSEDYPGSIFASIIAQKIGLIGPQPKHVLLCQHKYYSRCAQQQCVPDATPEFYLLDKVPPRIPLSFPLYIKPVKSFFSVGACRVDTHDQLCNAVEHSVLPSQFLEQFNWFLQHYSPYELPSNYLLAETCLLGHQVTIEGYVCDGEVTTLGVTDSIFFPGTISFKRFEYPSSLSDEVQERMAIIAKKCMRGIGFDNGMFNIEMMYNPVTDDIHIIEINPRMASQFADMHEKVDGVNSYSLLLDLVTGKKPRFEQGKGPHAITASFVFRIFEDKKVVAVPSEQDVANFYREFPDARLQIFSQPGKKLSDEFQDGNSYRYGLVHLGGSNKKDLFAKWERAQELLPFGFKSL